jgi:hypothetical protein
MKLGFSPQIFEKYSKCMKIPPVGAEFHEDGRTDTTKLVTFHSFANAFTNQSMSLNTRRKNRPVIPFVGHKVLTTLENDSSHCQLSRLARTVMKRQLTVTFLIDFLSFSRHRRQILSHLIKQHKITKLTRKLEIVCLFRSQ